MRPNNAAARAPVLETERLCLRRLVPEDVEALGRILDDPEVMRYFGSKENQLAAARKWMDLYETQGFGMLAAEAKLCDPPDPESGAVPSGRSLSPGAFVGRVGFAVQRVAGRDEVELGWLVAREHWGQGLATEAAGALVDYGFRRFGFPRIISLIDPENAASIAVARKLGQTYVRDVAMFGKPVIRVYSITRPNETT